MMPPSPSLNWNALLLGPLLRAFLPLFALLLAILVVQWLLYRWKLHRLAQSGIEEIDRMTGRQFEEYLEALFTKLGYQVERTPYVGDYGADLVVRKAGVKTVIQAKRHKGRIGVKAVGEVLRAKGNYHGSSAMIVTNSSFTRQAEEEARSNGIELWDRDQLIRQLLVIKASSKSSGNNTGAAGQSSLETSPRTFSSVPIPAGFPDAPPLAEHPAEVAGAARSAATCMVCGKAVSEKVKQYCLDRPYKFGGHIYCFEHQGHRSSH